MAQKKKTEFGTLMNTEWMDVIKNSNGFPSDDIETMYDIDNEGYARKEINILAESIDKIIIFKVKP